MQSLDSLLALSAADLDRESLKVGNRQYSLACTRLAHAKRALECGDREEAGKFARGAKVSYLRACEDEAGQVRRAEAVQAVSEERGTAIALKEGERKNVAVNPVFTCWTFMWSDSAGTR